jgi:hypothetical protein
MQWATYTIVKLPLEKATSDYVASCRHYPPYEKFLSSRFCPLPSLFSTRPYKYSMPRKAGVD